MAEQVVIRWTVPKLKMLHEAHASALKEGKESFKLPLDGKEHEFLVSYAGYLIAFLKQKLAQ